MPAIIIAIVAALALAGAYFFMGNTPAPQAQEPAPTPLPEAQPTPTPATTTGTTTLPTSTSSYKDGSYSQTGEYRSPAGSESITASVTLKDGVITDATFTGTATHAASKRWQGAFNDGVKAAVVGKNIDEVSLSVVNGSSLTPKGYMDALAKIKTEASK